MYDVKNFEIDSINKFKKDAMLRGDKVLEFCNYGDVVYDMDNFDFTKVTGAKLIIGNSVVPLEKTTTWAGLLRSVNKSLEGWKTGMYEITFNTIIKDVVETYGLSMNYNFSMELYTDDSFIKSSVYKSNQNHKLEVLNGKYICAVYSGEVVVVLNALVGAASKNVENDKVTLLVSYKKRINDVVVNKGEKLCKRLNEQVEKITAGMNKEQLKEFNKSYVEMLRERLEGDYVDKETGEKFMIMVEDEDDKIDRFDMLRLKQIVGSIRRELDYIEVILEGMEGE